MRKWVILLWISAAAAQAVTVAEIGTVPLQADAFSGRDASGFLYGIQNSTFFKTKDHIRLEYKNMALGNIARVDLQNPLRIVLFYADFNAVVMLDNQLNEIQRILFSEMEPAVNVTACGLASQNRLWIYDSLSQRIGSFDYIKGTMRFLTPPLELFAQYDTTFNSLRWRDSKGQLFSCDIYGEITAYGSVDHIGNIVFGDSGLYFFDNGALQFLEYENRIKTSAVPLGKTVKNFYLADGILSIFTGHEITNYKITLR